eukprot:31129-Pelagococcus_subviridis.AAC.3
MSTFTTDRPRRNPRATASAAAAARRLASASSESSESESSESSSAYRAAFDLLPPPCAPGPDTIVVPPRIASLSALSASDSS